MFSTTDLLVRNLLALVLVLGIVIAVYVIVRLKRGGAKSLSSDIMITRTKSLGGKSRLFEIVWQGKILLVAMNNDQLTLLSEHKQNTQMEHPDEYTQSRLVEKSSLPEINKGKPPVQAGAPTLAHTFPPKPPVQSRQPLSNPAPPLKNPVPQQNPVAEKKPVYPAGGHPAQVDPRFREQTKQEPKIPPAPKNPMGDL